METYEVMRLLSHARHDLMNQIQLLQGYISMNKPEKIKQKLQDMVLQANQQRKLTDTQANEFALWLLQVNINEKHIRMDYDVHVENMHLQHLDVPMLNKAKHTLESIGFASNPDELLHVLLRVYPNDETTRSVKLQFMISGKGLNQKLLKETLQYGKVENVTDEQVILTIIISQNQ